MGLGDGNPRLNSRTLLLLHLGQINLSKLLFPYQENRALSNLHRSVQMKLSEQWESTLTPNVRPQNSPFSRRHQNCSGGPQLQHSMLGRGPPVPLWVCTSGKVRFLPSFPELLPTGYTGVPRRHLWGQVRGWQGAR